MTIDKSRLPYRPAAGVMLLNPANQVWVGQRIDSDLDAWQMPQGGLDPGETPLEGALRELEEETGIHRDLVDVIAMADRALLYDLPDALIGQLWGGQWRGQSQHWLLARFLGSDSDVRLETAHPEFRAWQWVAPERLPGLIVPFKKALYEAILAEFAPHLG